VPAGIYPWHGSTRSLAGWIGPCKSGLERRNASFERFVLLAGETGHIFDGFELLAPNNIEVPENAFCLAAEQRLELAPNALRNAGRIVHQTSNLVEEAIRRLDHVCLRPEPAKNPSPAWLAMLADNGDGAARPQGAWRSETERVAWKTKMLVLPVIPFPHINPVLISIGPLAVRWYALAYIVGIIAGWYYARAIIVSQRLWGGPAPFTVTDFDDFIIWVTLGIIFGGRIGYVLFYNLPHFTAHPIEILALWNGGMSFHGGFLGCVVAVVGFALHRGIPILSLGDVTTAVAPIGLFLGRIANFINGELWGRPTEVPWAMIFPNGGPVPRHPSQLYEAALEGLVLLIVLGMLARVGALKRPGFVLGAFALGYGVARTTCEFFREPDAQLGFLWGGLTMGMLLCIPLILAGLGLLAFAMTRAPIAKNG